MVKPTMERHPSKQQSVLAIVLFADVVLAQVYYMQMVSMLGYDIMFQDVDDMILLEFFHSSTSISVVSYVMIFQDDDDRMLNVFSPYCVNAGFYYV
jgi:hypothetical protein